MEKKYTGDTRLRVFNRCNYDIGIRLLTGMTVNIIPNSFAMLSVDDIMYIESICHKKKVFSAKMLVPVDEDGNDLTLEDLGGYSDSYTEKHFDNDEITAYLRKSTKAFGEWLKPINDKSELAAIWEIAKTMEDLQQSKMKLIKAKMPQKDLLEDDE